MEEKIELTKEDVSNFITAPWSISTKILISGDVAVIQHSSPYSLRHPTLISKIYIVYRKRNGALDYKLILDFNGRPSAPNYFSPKISNLSIQRNIVTVHYTDGFGKTTHAIDRR